MMDLSNAFINTNTKHCLMACGYCPMDSRVSKGSVISGWYSGYHYYRVTITVGITALETRGSYGVTGARMG